MNISKTHVHAVGKDKCYFDIRTRLPSLKQMSEKISTWRKNRQKYEAKNVDKNCVVDTYFVQVAKKHQIMRKVQYRR